MPADTPLRPARRAPRAPAPRRLVVDRVLCTGRGVCAELLPGQVRLDEWGYPIVDDDRVGRRAGDRAVAWCPARALHLRDA